MSVATSPLHIVALVAEATGGGETVTVVEAVSLQKPKDTTTEKVEVVVKEDVIADVVCPVFHE